MIRFWDFQLAGAPPLLSWVVRRRVDRAGDCEDGARSGSSCGRVAVALLAILIRTHKHLRCIGEKK